MNQVFETLPIYCIDFHNHKGRTMHVLAHSQEFAYLLGKSSFASTQFTLESDDSGPLARAESFEEIRSSFHMGILTFWLKQYVRIVRPNLKEVLGIKRKSGSLRPAPLFLAGDARVRRIDRARIDYYAVGVEDLTLDITAAVRRKVRVRDTGRDLGSSLADLRP